MRTSSMIDLAGKAVAALSAVVLFSSLAHAEKRPDTEIWRLDCGTLKLTDAAQYSDAYLYDGKPLEFVNGCYLIRNGTRYMLWDAGLPAALKGRTEMVGAHEVSIKRTLVEQLADIGLSPSRIAFVGVSHYHFDHLGQALHFPAATLLMHQRDLDRVRTGFSQRASAGLAPWIAGEGKAVGFERDHDVFGDGSVTILQMPGHTPGHSALLVRLGARAPILLSGDTVHFREQFANRGVPLPNVDRADSLASMERLQQIAKSLGATLVIQHDARDVGRLPAFPASAK